MTRGVCFIFAMGLALAACVKTDLLVNAFNDGALDTSVGDPHEDPDVAAAELVASRVRRELGDGYFGQGRQDPYVAGWMEAVSGQGWFTTQVVKQYCVDIADLSPCKYAALAGTPSETTLSKSQRTTKYLQVQKEMREAVRDLAPVEPAQPFCSNGNWQDIQRFADRVRLQAAIERAVSSVASLLREGLVSLEHIRDGGSRGFAESAQYLRDRGWSRSVDQPTLGLVVKGGAVTGVYSAGAVWVVLNMITECLRDPECARDPQGRQRDVRFKLLSGTSTGALVVTVVDRFNTIGAGDHDKRRQEIAHLAQLFTCSGIDALYCVRSKPILDLTRNQTSLLDFDGLRGKLRSNVCCQVMLNDSELILNTVDFRSGRLHALSDQERFSLRTGEDIVQGALASAVLPVIAQPVTTLPVNLDPAVPQTYLDGGIRSEIPLVPLARRGAERVLIVASSSSIPVGTNTLDNAGQIALRYIDVSLAGVIESDLALGQAQVESMRLAESDLCHEELRQRFKMACPAGSSCNHEALCRSRWSEVCAGPSPVAPEPDGVDAELSDLRLEPRASRIESVWKTVGIFRDESRVEPLHGYAFDPPEQRRLFLAGAESVRAQCVRIASLLGIPAKTPAERRKLVDWCAPALPAKCSGGAPEATDDHRTCSEVEPAAPEALLRQCRPASGTPAECTHPVGAP